MTLPPTPAPKEFLPQPSPAIETIESFDKLLTTSDGISFEEVMRERNRIRKEKEEYNIAELKVQISRLEEALTAETRRRVDATTSLDDQARLQVYEMEERLKKQLEEDNIKLEHRLATLESRIGELEHRWTQEAHSQVESVQRKGEEFAKALEQLQQEQDVERKARLRREGSLLRQVENHAKEFEDRWTSERKDRINRVATLEASLLKKEEKRSQERAAFQQRVDEELSALKAEIDLEIQERQIQDEDIVSALNRYTQQLQQSLSILSSD